MTTRLEIKLKINSFDEKPYRESEDGRKFTQTNIALSVSQERIEADVTWDAVSYYAADGTGTYVGLMHFAGRLGDRTGSFVLQGSGSYDGTQARIAADVVPWSGTGELAGIRGTGTSVSTHADYPFMPLTLDYETP